ncbi:TPM domain-containing protein [Bdellovibrionota bacterium FG-1]
MIVRLSLAFALLTTLVTLTAANAQNATPFDQPPYYILDENKILTERQTHALSSLLIEHDKASGEQIIVGLFQSLPEEGAETAALRTSRIFNQWPVSQRPGGEGALLAIYIREHQAAFEAGYGLSTRIREGEVRRILGEFLFPELKAQQTYRAIGLSLVEILRILESPLMESGRAQEILRAGGLQNEFTATRRAANHWWLWVLGGLTLLLGMLSQLASSETHFTSSGWFKPKLWKRLPTNQSQNNPLIQAIAEAEAGTTGEIRVHLSKRFYEKNPLKRALQLFTRFGLTHTAQRNTVLIYVNLRKNKFAIVGDIKIHETVSRRDWNRLTDELAVLLRETHSERAITLTALALGTTLREHFPTIKDLS